MKTGYFCASPSNFSTETKLEPPDTNDFGASRLKFCVVPNLSLLKVACVFEDTYQSNQKCTSNHLRHGRFLGARHCHSCLATVDNCICNLYSNYTADFSPPAAVGTLEVSTQVSQTFTPVCGMVALRGVLPVLATDGPPRMVLVEGRTFVRVPCGRAGNWHFSISKWVVGNG